MFIYKYNYSYFRFLESIKKDDIAFNYVTYSKKTYSKVITIEKGNCILLTLHLLLIFTRILTLIWIVVHTQLSAISEQNLAPRGNKMTITKLSFLVLSKLNSLMIANNS